MPSCGFSTRAELKHLQHELATTTIYVTHDQIEAMTLADRVAVMNAGVIQQLATPEEIYDKPANLFVAGFIGSPAMNLISGETNNGAFLAEAVKVPEIGGGTRGGLVLGIRPEDLTVVEAGQGHFDAPVYATELTGESILVTVTAGGQQVCARGPRHLRKEIGELVGIRADVTHAHLFDSASEQSVARG